MIERLESMLTNRVGVSSLADVAAFMEAGVRLVISKIVKHLKIITRRPISKMATLILLIYITAAIFSPFIVPYDPEATQRTDGEIDRLEPPSSKYLFGTTTSGRDVFSQTIVSSRVSLFVGFLAAFVAIAIGTTVGIVSAYYGGWVDDLLMRTVDTLYALPFIPFLFILVIFLGQGILNITFAIGLVMWRGSARVIRSQTLSIKERPYIEAAEAAGVSNLRMMYAHILPNVLPLAFLYGSISISAAILAEAGISFLGLGDPNLLSWGQMINLAFSSGTMRVGWWWAVAPGLSITLIVLSVFLISREYESVANPELDQTIQT